MLTNNLTFVYLKTYMSPYKANEVRVFKFRKIKYEIPFYLDNK